MIDVKNLSKDFNGKAAVKKISFQVNEGETLVLLGTSGSGKTTTLRMINRLIEPTNGEILMDGKSIFSTPPEILRRSIGYVLQNYGLFPHYTVAENIAIVPQLLKWPKDKIDQRTTELLDNLRLPAKDFAHVFPDKLSGGQKQRVGLARAMAANPPILLMDEPFGALDPLTRIGIRDEFFALDELKKKTVILVTHDVQEAFAIADKICLMDKGEIVQIGSPIDLLFKPNNDFVKQFLEHQQLQLELNTISLKSIWNELTDANNKFGTILNSSQNLWEAIELLTHNYGDITAVDKDSNSIKSITFNNIQTALNKLKNN